MEHTTNVEVTVLFFAKSRELSGVKETVCTFKSPTTSLEVLQSLLDIFTGLVPIKDNLVLSLNEEYLEINDERLCMKSGDELATMNHIEIIDEKIKIEETVELVVSPSCGAISTFLGTTRDNFDGKKVVRLEYEAYIPMAKKKMLEICNLVREKWTVENIAIIHRIGLVPIKEASIIIAVSSAHRQASLQAVQFAIDTLKAIVPIWKKEVYEDETNTWKENKEWKNGKLAS